MKMRRSQKMVHKSYWIDITQRLLYTPGGMIGLLLVCTISFVALYAPFFAASKPIAVVYDGTLYFPLLRYFFSSTYFTKKIDLFCNIAALWLPLFLLTFTISKRIRKGIQLLLAVAALFFFTMIAFFVVIDPAVDAAMNKERQEKFLHLIQEGHQFPDFQFELRYMNQYAKLNMVLADVFMKKEHEAVIRSLPAGYKEPYTMYSLKMSAAERNTSAAKRRYVQEKNSWIKEQEQKISFIIYPIFRLYHWEDDAGGDQAMNRALPFYELSRTSRQDLMSAIIYGARISLFVGLVSTMLALLIGVPLGLVSGYVGGRLDIVLCRCIEVWEAMPAFFMLLMIVTILETKSIFLVIAVIALFNWTQAFRFVRAETFRQREMAYIEASLALGFPSSRIIFSQLLPNCIVPIIALLPFDIMAAITREAGLAFLGLGEEHSCSWGVLMDEGREAFPQESALLWPPAIALTILLMAIAFVGNALQKALNPKSQ